jgi:hypothetical protein
VKCITVFVAGILTGVGVMYALLLKALPAERVTANNNPLEGDDGPFAPSCKDVHESPF